MTLVDDFNGRLFGNVKERGLSMAGKIAGRKLYTSKQEKALARVKRRESRQPNWRKGGLNPS
jgi:hypothetical protein